MKRTPSRRRTAATIPGLLVLSLVFSLISGGVAPVQARDAEQEGVAIQVTFDKEATANRALRLTLQKSESPAQVAGKDPPSGKAWLVLATEWENIHPKQKVRQGDLQGKKRGQDDTLGGFGGFQAGPGSGGETEAEDEELVDADVAYLVPTLVNHAYVLADAESYALDPATDPTSKGSDEKYELLLPKLHDKKPARLVFAIPAGAKNVAFQLLDYDYGHLLVRIRGDLKLAGGGGGLPGGTNLDTASDDLMEIAARSLDYRAEYQGDRAPAGWRFAVLRLTGRSRGAVGDDGAIVQIDPKGFIWLATPRGHLYYGAGGTLTDEGCLRFTPVVWQSQEVAFLVPAGEAAFVAGIRNDRAVHILKLGGKAAAELPRAAASFKDGKVMEFFVFGKRGDRGAVMLDLGIRALTGDGLEIGLGEQFVLLVGEEEIAPSPERTAELAHRPPEPFVVPPKGFVRFEVAFEGAERAKTLLVRGFEGEKRIDLGAIGR